jgi:DNA modification methylase
VETEHSVVVGDARERDEVASDSVELVVTSPPYPMVEMWDETFSDLEPDIGRRLDDGDGRGAFELMHDQLRSVWEEVERVVIDGGIACVNVGDATRTVGESFRVYQNHSRIVDAFEDLGFEPLPELLWRKPVNSAAKFMGSGMLPPNAYVTLEHEYVLTFRNGHAPRSFEPGADERYEAAYFWEERNQWFSDVWTDVGGALQELQHTDLRDRSAAFPFEIPYRLISMYSVYGDTVLDPFWGTGTTSLAAIVAGRNSIGYELQAEFAQVFDARIRDVPELSEDVVGKRLREHRQFVERKHEAGEELEYGAENYDFPVTTKQEKRVQFYAATDVSSTGGGYRVKHEPVDGTGDVTRIEQPDYGGATSHTDS